ncbi:MAG: hypothetical protein SCARUB_02757 [Candidatus Scalindua rubra]|uniref:PIN domain-containing protein n=1 Tax=Candidatus Scalindua rubra TaxID=1872076 RepID=A0A1E3X8Z0_9BACT|nr:MAG: hypothetical protein SCARUB_02757 [Candidatus Scalindua rubra]
MKILMDSDCLIKLTKGGTKETICYHYEIFIPKMVKKEVVDVGKIKGHSDANLVEKNIKVGMVRVAKEYSRHTKGDQSLIEIFKSGKYDIIATDDIKLTRLLKSTAIPFIFPGLLVYSLYKRRIISQGDAISWLNKISTFISDDEYSTVKLLLEKNR